MEKFYVNGQQVTKQEFDRMQKEKPTAVVPEVPKLKKLLQSTDYVASKLSEAQAIYTLTGDRTKLEEVYGQYKDILDQREQWRIEINKLQ